MLPGIKPALFGVGATGNDSYTKLLLHFDGADNSTIYKDSSLAAHGNATLAGSTKLLVAQKKFGVSSAWFDGSTGYATFPNHADYNFGAGPFTVEWYEYRQTATGGAGPIVRDTGVLYTPWLVGYYSAPNLLFYASSNATAWDISNGRSFGAAELNVWHHFAVTRSGDTFYMFRDGVQMQAWGVSAGLAFPAGGNPLALGCAWQGQFYGGFLDEVRISKGVCRWTASFSPPSAPYGP